MFKFSKQKRLQPLKTVLNFGNLDFEFVSDFDIRISNLT